MSFLRRYFDAKRRSATPDVNTPGNKLPPSFLARERHYMKCRNMTELRVIRGPPGGPPKCPMATRHALHARAIRIHDLTYAGLPGTAYALRYCNDNIYRMRKPGDIDDISLQYTARALTIPNAQSRLYYQNAYQLLDYIPL